MTHVYDQFVNKLNLYYISDAYKKPPDLLSFHIDQAGWLSEWRYLKD